MYKRLLLGLGLVIVPPSLLGMQDLTVYDLKFSDGDKNLVLGQNGDKFIHWAGTTLGINFPVSIVITFSSNSSTISYPITLYTYYLYTYNKRWMLGSRVDDQLTFIDINKGDFAGCVYNKEGCCTQKLNEQQLSSLAQTLKKASLPIKPQNCST